MAKTLNIAFPLGGIDRRTAYQWQKPYKTVDALNVVPSDPLLFRDRGGVRPGLTKYAADSYPQTPRALLVATKLDGTRKLIAVTEFAPYSSAINGSDVTGGPATDPITDVRIQAVQFLDMVYYIGKSGDVYPQIYDPGGGTPSALNPSGAPSVDWPTASPSAIMVKYDCLWVAFVGDNSGTAGAPSRFWLSAVGDPDDFEDDRDGTDPTTAYSAEVNSTREGITAMIPWFGNYAIIATANTMYVVDGHPRAGGLVRRCSDKLGIVDCASWCIGEDDTIVAMSASGPILIPPGATPQPQLLLSDVLPAVLTAPDTANYDHVLAYDSRARRVYIFRSKISATSGVDHYVLDLQDKTWWRYQFGNTDHEPLAAIALRDIASQRTDVLLACRDGYLRYFDETAATDDGTNITSYVWLGPFRAADGIWKGIWNELVVSLALNSGDVTVSLHRGNNAEEAYNAAASWSRTFSAGRSPTRNPRVGGETFYLKITGTAGYRWAFENAVGVIIDAGKVRV